MNSDRRSGVNIPVIRDSRTYEQSCKDSYKSMTTSSKRIVDDGYQHSSLRSDTTAPTFASEIRPMGMSKDLWGDDFDSWSRDFHSKWEEDFDKRRRNIFSLHPVDPFNDNDDDFPSFRKMETSSSRIREQMEREMQSLRQQMDSMSKLGSNHHLSGPNAHTVQSSTSTRVYSSKSSTQRGSDPQDTVTKSDVVESNQQSRTINGQTISSSSHASSSTSSKGSNEQPITSSSNIPGALIKQSTGDRDTVLETIDNNCEKDADGKYHFKVHFDAKDFTPEDIDVSTADNRLTVCAKRIIKTDGGTSTREFRRTIELPHSIDHENFRCNLTNDGVLIVDAPVSTPGLLTIKSNEPVQSVNQPNRLQVFGEDKIINAADGRRLHLEVKIEPKYKPEELSIKVNSDYIIVTGQQSVSNQHASCEFTHKIRVREPILHHTIENELIGHTLVIEARLSN